MWLITTHPQSSSFSGAPHALINQLECLLYKFLIQGCCSVDLEHSVDTIRLAALEVEFLKLLFYKPIKMIP